MRLIITALCVAVIAMCGQVQAQDQHQDKNAEQQRNSDEVNSKNVEMQESTMLLPSNEQLIELKTRMPAQIRVSQTFKYEIIVSNRSDNIVLRDVKVQQNTGHGLSIESAKIEDPSNSSNSSQDSSQKNKQANKGTDQNKKPADADKKKSGQDAKKDSKQNANADQQSQKSQGSEIWTIDELQPGQTRRITVQATSDKEGKMNACLAITSYTPVLCVAIEVVHPQLQIVKQGPEAATMCDKIEYVYQVKNTGSGVARSITVVDKLGKGLQTTDGDKTLKFNVDAIEPGESRRFVANLVATKTGEFTSRASAKLPSGENVRSGNITTKVVEANLDVAIDGPELEYINRPMSYKIRVTNNGEAIAKDAKLTLRYPDQLSIISVGDVTNSDKAVKSTNSQKNDANNNSASSKAAKGQDAKANAKNGQDNDQDKAKDQKADQGKKQWAKLNEDRSFDLGTLKPNETKVVTVTLRGGKAVYFPLEAVVTDACGRSGDNKADQATASLRGQVVALSALLLKCVDKEDPVRTGGNVEYVITVLNQGDAPDENVQLHAVLPKGLKFVKGEGETKVSAEGQNLTIEPVAKLEAGEKAVWNVICKAETSGEVLFKVNLDSDDLKHTVTAEESTQLFGEKSSK